MEDERGDVGQVSALSLSNNLPGETHSGGNRVEGSFEEGDGGEIMVEVVGSDVLVDGVSGNKEVDFGSGEVRDLEGHVWRNGEEPDGTQNLLEAMAVSTKTDENKSAGSVSELSMSKDEKTDAVTKGDVNLTETACVEGSADCALLLRGVSVSDKDVRSTGADEATPSLAAVLKTVENDVVPKTTPAAISEDKSEKNDSVEDCTLPSRGVSDSGDEIKKPEVDVVLETTPAAVSEDNKSDRDELVKDSAESVQPEFLNHPVEAVGDNGVGVAEKEEELPSTDDATSHDYLGAVSGTSSQDAAAQGGQVIPSEVFLNPSSVQNNHIRVDGINIVVGEASLVASDSGQEPVVHGSTREGSRVADTENACGEEEVKFTDAKEVNPSETEELIVSSDATVSDVVDGRQSGLDEDHGPKVESNHGIDGTPLTNPQTNTKISCVMDGVNVESGGLNDGASDINLPKAGGEMDTDMACKDDVLSNEPAQIANRCDISEVNENENLNAVSESGAGVNLPDMSTVCPGDDEIRQGDSGICETQSTNVEPGDMAIDDEKVASTEVKVVVGDGSNENSAMPKQSSEHDEEANIPAPPAAENMKISTKGECPCSDVEMADVAVMDHQATANSQCDDNTDPSLVPSESNDVQVSVQFTETPNYGVANHEDPDLTPKEINGVGAVSDILPEITEQMVLPSTEIRESSVSGLVASSDEVNISMEADDNSSRQDALCFLEGQHSETKLIGMDDERDTDRSYHCEMAELVTEEPVENENLLFSVEEMVNSVQLNMSGYILPLEDEGHFSVSDLVWGKANSHPWWPGQVFDPADASEKAVKHYKKDTYLIAYFGDQTFTWSESSELKPFRSYFSQIETQDSSEDFQNAVNCALEEVSRRIELGLLCSCIPKDAYSEIESQVVENAGIREESSRLHGVDRFSQATHFEPNKLLDYIKDLACDASFGADRMDVVIAQSQLSAFCRSKGHRLLTGFPSTGKLLENDADTEQITNAPVVSLECKHPPENDSPSRKEKSLTELMGDKEYTLDAEDDTLSPGRKRKALDPLADVSAKKVSTVAAKSPAMNQTPKPSFKIGECIRRVASQLKGSNDETAIDGSPRIYEHTERRSLVFTAESFSSNEILLQLQLLALSPKLGENILNNIHNFFIGFRSSISLNRRGRKKKADSAVGGSGEEFEFDDVNDSYWTDRIVHNYPEEQLVNNSSESREGNLHLVSFGEEKSAKPGRKSRKRFSSMAYPMGDSDADDGAKRKKQESSPAELILNFAERNFLPSEINLNKMFRRFGPLMESETEVDHNLGRAKVIFKRGSDAEVARNSSEKFNIFGRVPVNYQIGYSPLISVRISPLALPPQGQEDVSLLM